MSLDVVTIVQPYERLADQPFSLEWELGADDGSHDGVPEDVTDVTAVRVTAQLQTPRGVTRPAPKVWTLTSGASFETVTDGAVWPVLVVAEPTGLPAGGYDVIVSFTRTGGVDWPLRAVLQLTEQP